MPADGSASSITTATERVATELVEDALAAGAVAVGVAGDALLDVVVVDAGVDHGLDPGLEAHLGVVDQASRLDELCQPDADDVHVFFGHDGSGGGGDGEGAVRDVSG